MSLHRVGALMSKGCHGHLITSSDQPYSRYWYVWDWRQQIFFKILFCHCFLFNKVCLIICFIFILQSSIPYYNILQETFSSMSKTKMWSTCIFENNSFGWVTQPVGIRTNKKHQLQTFSVSKLWDFYKNITSCVEYDCCIPSTINIWNVNFS